MRSSIFLVSLVASGAIAVDPVAIRHALQPRQTDASQCGTSALELLGSLPTPPPSLASSVGNSRNPCNYSVPDSLTKDYSSYSSQVQSWYSSNAPNISSLISKCSTYASITQDYAACTSILAQVTTLPNAAPRETGLAVAAIAAAGAGFVAAML